MFCPGATAAVGAIEAGIDAAAAGAATAGDVATRDAAAAYPATGGATTNA